MTEENSENKNLKNYLLGLLTQGLDQIEERLMTDDGYFQALLIEEDELIGEYIDDNLDKTEKLQFETHFLISDERRKKLSFARALRRKVDERLAEKKPQEETNEPQKIRTAGFFAKLFAAPFPVAAGFLVVFCLSAFLVWNFYLSRSDNSELALVSLNKAFKNERPLDARISAFEYAPKTNTRGGDGAEEKINTIELSRAENLILKNASENPNAENLHALGRLYLAKKEFDKAIKELEKSEKLDPQNAQTQNDLGVAYLEKSRILSEDEGTKAELSGKALDRFKKALDLNPNLHEARFNNAINLQLLNLKNQAKEAWTQYLKLDSNSNWAEEARRNLSNLETESSRNKTSEEILRDFFAAYRNRDSDTAYRIVSANREMITGKLIPQQLAFLFLETEGADRRENLEALQFIGEIETEKSGDRYFKEIADYYNSLSKEQIVYLTNAKNSVQKGYQFCLKLNYKDSLAQFISAREFYIKAGNIREARLCDYWIAYCEFLTDRLRKSTDRLIELTDYCEKNNFKWLAAQAFYWLSINAKAMKEISKSIQYAESSLKFSEEMNDLYNTQKSLSWLADSYLQINQFQKAFFHIQKALNIGKNPDSSIRQKGRDLDVAARLFFSTKMYETAGEFQKEMLDLYAKEIKDLSYARVGYTNLANIYAARGKFEEALEFAEKGKQVSETLTDEMARSKATAYSNLYIAELKRKNNDCLNALENYAQAIQIYDSMEFQAGKFLALKGRLLCGAKDKNDGLIQAELPKMLNLFEENRQKITEEQNRNAFFDGEQDIYDLAIEYEFSNGNFEKAFDYSEESRSRSLLDLMKNGVKFSDDDADIKVENVTEPLNLQEILRSLPTSVQIVQYAVLEQKTIIWLISENNIKSFSVETASADLNEKITAFLSAISAKDQDRQQNLSRELYKILIEPIEKDFDVNKEIYLIPDKKLFYFPFAALISDKTNRYLIADYKIGYSPSTNVFLTSTENANYKEISSGEKLLSIGNPSFNRKEFADLPDLPAASREAREITEYYQLPTLLLGKQATKHALLKEIGQADIVHFAGHYIVNEHSPLQSGFLVAPDEKNSELENHELLKQNLEKPRLIVLSACDTALEGFYKGEGTMGAGRTFLAIGIPLVVASQWQVDSDATAELMKKFHFYRKTRNLSTVAALQKAQMEMLDNPNSNFNQPYFWAGFLTLGGYARY